MKKSLSILLAVIMAVSLASFPALAGDLPTDDSVAYISLKGEYGAKTSDLIPPEIPVYGFVGPDDEIIDPDPEDPDKPPIIVEVNVSVPVKIIWAAFQGGSGVITSPEYRVINHSSTRDLKVKMLSFQPRSGAPDNANVDSKLVLNMLSTAGQFGASNNISNGNGSTAAFPVYAGNPLAFSGTLAHGNGEWKFKLGGMWNGSFPSVHYKPIYDMVLEFNANA
jgi:hypothetical protein